ncbi:MAG: hypothetical protein JO053_09445 [Acidobacteria bacterium]|nr:hypothetical protein [Acidobacteriota bacterium]
MTRFDSPLNNISVASPCPADWDQMYGDERKRFCGDCKLNVYNLSGMTKAEAEALVTNHEGRLCVRYYQRADGSIITADCPVGWAKVKQRTKMYATAVASLLMALFTGVLFVQLFSAKSRATVGVMIPYATPTPTPDIPPTMGAIAYRPENSNVKVRQGDMTVVQGNFAVPPSKKTTNSNSNSKFEKAKQRALSHDDLQDG